MSILLTQIGFLDYTPCRRIVLALRQACDEVAGIAQDAQLATAGQWDRIVEGAGPALVRHQSLIRFSTRVCLCPNSGAIADIPQPRLRAKKRHCRLALKREGRQRRNSSAPILWREVPPPLTFKVSRFAQTLPSRVVYVVNCIILHPGPTSEIRCR